MAAHLGKEGIVLFGHHTTAKKVSIETDKFKAISIDKLPDKIKLWKKIKSSMGNGIKKRLRTPSWVFE